MPTPAADEPGLARDATALRWSRRVMSARPVAWLVRRSEPGVHVLVSASVVIGMVAVVRSAWVSDDAFIALRAVENFVTGHGLLSNPPERVQAFTSPLWALCMALPRALTSRARACAASGS